MKVHSYAKPLLLRYYLRPFTTILSHNFGRFVYLDAFSGPGRVSFKIGGTKYEYDGSPLVALNTKPPFTDYIFIEKSQKFARALELRCEKSRPLRNPLILRGDSNQIIPTLLNVDYQESSQPIWRVPQNYHILAFLDPRGLELNWNTVECIAARKYREIIINFSNGVFRIAKSARENKRHYRAISSFMGYDDNWWKYSGEELLALYKSNLAQSGKGFQHVEALPVRNSLGLTVYYLLFATNNEKGLKIVRRRMDQLEKLKWREVGSTLEVEAGQPSLENYSEGIKEVRELDQKLTLFTSEPKQH